MLRIRNFNGGAIQLRWLRGNSKKSKVREAVLGATDRDDDAGRPRLASICLSAVVLPSPEIGIGDDLSRPMSSRVRDSDL